SMSTAFTDRNLLVGMLALQNGLIDRNTLFAAMQAWLSDREQPLERFIREQGGLSSDDEKLLGALVSTDRGRKGEKPPQGSVRELLGRIAETDRSGELGWATTFVRDDSSEEKSAGAEPSVSGSRASLGAVSHSGHRFQIVRRH